MFLRDYLIIHGDIMKKAILILLIVLTGACSPGIHADHQDRIEPGELKRTQFQRIFDDFIFATAEIPNFGNAFRRLNERMGIFDPYVFYRLTRHNVLDSTPQTSQELINQYKQHLLSNQQIHRKDLAVTYVQTTGNKVEVLENAKAYYSQLITDMKGAKKSIDIIQFGFKCDKLGSEIAAILREKAKDIKVRLIVDAMGSEVMPLSLKQNWSDEILDIEKGLGRMEDKDDASEEPPEFFNNLLAYKSKTDKRMSDTEGAIGGEAHSTDSLERSSEKNNHNLKMYLGMMDGGVHIKYHQTVWKFRMEEAVGVHFDHRKLIIIDRNTAYMGGRGFEEHFRSYETTDGIHVPGMYDCMIKLVGPIVQHLNLLFSYSWQYEGNALPSCILVDEGIDADRVDDSKFIDELMLEEFPSQRVEGNTRITLYQNVPGLDFAPVTVKYYELIDRAKKGEKLYLTNPYYSDSQITSKLIEAKKRGVDVRLVLPLAGEKYINKISIANEIEKLKEAGVKVYLYPLLLHAKILLTEGEVFVGSTNLDWMSLYHNWEMNVLIGDPKIVSEFEKKYFDIYFLNKYLAENVNERYKVTEYELPANMKWLEKPDSKEYQDLMPLLRLKQSFIKVVIQRCL